ncbi:MAG: sulfatase/phosphatase domain-containing protein [Planctomycetota bacterium]
MHPTMRASKSTPYEESIHIPFIMRYPRRVKAGQRTRAMFSSVDVMPTLLSLCGVRIPSGVQGHDLAHVVTGKDDQQRPDSVYLMNMGLGWPDRDQWVGCWRGVRNIGGSTPAGIMRKIMSLCCLIARMILTR